MISSGTGIGGLVWAPVLTLCIRELGFRNTPAHGMPQYHPHLYIRLRPYLGTANGGVLAEK